MMEHSESKEAKARKQIEAEVTKRLQANRDFLNDLSKHLGISTEILGNAAYHTSLVTDQPVLEILATVRTFLIWVEKVQEKQQVGQHEERSSSP